MTRPARESPATTLWRWVAGGLTTAVLLSSCGGHDDQAGAPASYTDQQLFTGVALQGGEATIGWKLPFGGGTLVAGADYFYYDSSGRLSGSPRSQGSALETPIIATLDGAVPLPGIAPARILQAGQIWLLPPTAQRRIIYNSAGVREDTLAADGTTVLTSAQYFGYSEVPLSGFMGSAPEELMAAYPIREWISFDNFQSNARWAVGASYLKKHGTRSGDTVFAQDCGNSTTVTPANQAATNPCRAGTTLDSFFPITLLSGGSVDHPSETDFFSDGTISTVQGVRMWVASAALPAAGSPTQSYRVFYELSGSVYMGLLERDNTPFAFKQYDGSVVDYTVTFNQPAVDSIRTGLITGVVMPGSDSGSDAEVATEDLFGIGGHGVNGSLAPSDLRTHYNIPAGLSGAGQTIAIVNAPGSGSPADDLNVFSDYYGLPECNTANPCFRQIDLSNGAAPAAGEDTGSEVALDTQMAHAIAPQAQIILVTAHSFSFKDLVAAVNYAATLPGVTAVSLSYVLGGNASDISAEEATLAPLQSTLGMIFFACSGDAGSSQGARYPAASAYFTGVGGTRINSVAAVSSAQSEAAWEFSGGGAWSSIPMPPWQSGALTATMINENQGWRAVPDVSAVADAQHSAVGIYWKEQWLMSGGTSAATPLWAGVSTLLAESLAQQSRSLSALVASTSGGFNGLLYQAKLRAAAGGLVDIVSGTNNLSASPCPLCLAGPGYDDVTGLGAPDVANLIANF